MRQTRRGRGKKYRQAGAARTSNVGASSQGQDKTIFHPSDEGMHSVRSTAFNYH